MSEGINKVVRYLIKVLFVSCLCLGLGVSQANSIVAPVEVVSLDRQLSRPLLASSQWLLLDVLSHQVIASSNADRRFEPSDLTKLMTAYVLMRHLRNEDSNLKEEIKIPANALLTQGSKMYLEPGQKYQLHLLLQGLLVQQANDASLAIAYYVSGSEQDFVKKMNEYAVALGMTNTRFLNATGIEKTGQFTSLRDMSFLALALLNEYGKELSPLFGQQQLVSQGVSYPNKNRLLFIDSSVKGMMAANGNASMYSMVTWSQRGERQLLALTTKANSDALRVQDNLSLVNWGFQNFQTYKVYDTKQAVTELRVWKGSRTRVPVGSMSTVWLTVPNGQQQHVRLFQQRKDPIYAPLSVGEQVGTLSFKIGDQTLRTIRLQVLKNVSSSGLFRRIIDEIVLWFR